MSLTSHTARLDHGRPRSTDHPREAVRGLHSEFRVGRQVFGVGLVFCTLRPKIYHTVLSEYSDEDQPRSLIPYRCLEVTVVRRVALAPWRALLPTKISSNRALL